MGKKKVRVKFYINRDCSALSTTSSSLSESDDSVSDMKVERNIGGNVDVDRGMAQSDDAKWALSMIRI